MRLLQTYSAPYDVPVSVSGQSIFRPSSRWLLQSLAAYVGGAALGAISFLGVAVIVAEQRTAPFWITTLSWVVVLAVGTMILKRFLPATFVEPIQQSTADGVRESGPSTVRIGERSEAIPERNSQPDPQVEKMASAPLLSSPTTEAQTDARLEQAIATLDELIEVARGGGLGRSELFLDMAKVQLKLDLHGITDEEFAAFCDALERGTLTDTPQNQRITTIRRFTKLRLNLTASSKGRRRSRARKDRNV